MVKQFQQDWTRQLAPDAIRSACRDSGYLWRQRLLDPVVTIQLFFVQMLHGNTACTHLRHLAKVAVTASAYCQARMKLPLTVFQQLLRSVSNALQHEPLDEGRWLGHRTFWVDGSSSSMPDTPALQEHFGQPGRQLPGCGFPVAHLMTLLHAGTGMVLRVFAAPLRTHDMSQKELMVFALIDNLVHLVMGQATQRQHVDMERISFLDALRWLAAARDDEILITLVVNPHRPYRCEPRVRKRRPKQYPLM